MPPEEVVTYGLPDSDQEKAPAVPSKLTPDLLRPTGTGRAPREECARTRRQSLIPAGFSNSSPTTPTPTSARALPTQMNRPQQAVADLDKAIQLGPDQAQSYECRGLAYNRLGYYQGANSDLSQAIALNPKFPKTYYHRALAYRELDQPKKALSDLNRAIKLEPSYTSAYHLRSQVYLAMGKQEKAEADRKRALELRDAQQRSR